MAVGVLMPKEGITVESCIMGAWKKNVGDQVKIGDILFSYETDKAEFEVESTAEGTILAQFYNEGDEVPCLVNVCAVGNPGEDFSALDPKGGATAAPAPAPAAAPAPVAPTGPVATGVLMPKEGITVESCIMGAWKKNVGDMVKLGDILFSYETDKAEFEVESTAEGKLLAIFYNEGDEVPCLVNVCAIGKDGDDFASLDPKGATAAAPAPAAAPAQTAAPASAPAATAAPAATVSADGLHISPRAKQLAANACVDAALATPTGPNGRIIERDVRTLMESGITAAAPAPAPAAAPAPAPAAAPAQAAPSADYEDVKFTPVRKATAKAMLGSLQNSAQLTLNTSFDATQLQNYRKMCKAMEDSPVAKITLNDMVMFAVSRTLLDFKALNSNMVDDTTYRQFNKVNLGFACDAPKGLFVPVVKNCEKKSLLDISLECKKFAAEARDGKLKPDDMSGGTFTISNIGAFGVMSFTPVINPPQVAILGVCGIETKIKGVKDGNIVTYPAMGLSLTIDHRVIDGAPGARFLKALCANLENFMTLLAN
ncbi:MAG: 2-oxo acid dehydrogenase subunit E2 [Lachnospiraceae bacterium]|nr:2-oxo acid dehydrogenase subunit E2 [Lachnospiraceae bacterium]